MRRKPIIVILSIVSWVIFITMVIIPMINAKDTMVNLLAVFLFIFAAYVDYRFLTSRRKIENQADSSDMW